MKADIVHDDHRSNPAKIISAVNLQHNQEAASSCQVFVSIFAGAACGILGLTGWHGVLFFVACFLLTTLFLLFRLKFDIHFAFRSPWEFHLAGLSPGMMSFVLFWTLLYNIVHIY